MKLKTIRKLDVIYSTPNRNTSFRSLEEVMKHMDRVEKRLNELDEELKPLLDVKLVPVNAAAPDKIVFTDNSNRTRPKVMKSEDVTKIEVNKSDKKAVDKAYQRIKDYQNLDRDMQGFLSFIEKERNSRSYLAARKRALKIEKKVKESAKNAERVLKRIGKGYVDTHFKEFIKFTMEKVKKYYRGTYTKSTIKLFPFFADSHVEVRCYLIFDKIYGVKHKVKEDYCIMFSVILGGENHRNYYVKILDEGFSAPSITDDFGRHKAKNKEDAYNYIITRMAVDGIQEQGYFPKDIDFKKADWKDIANRCEIDKEGRWVRFKLKPGLPRGQQYKAADRLGKILLRKILDKSYHKRHEIDFDIYTEKASNGREMVWIEFTSNLKDNLQFNYTALKNLFPDFNDKQLVELEKTIQRISMEKDYI